MTTLSRGYDDWRLAGPDEDRNEIGTEDGQPCNRVPEPDEGQPRNYRPRRCEGTMVSDDDPQWPGVTCDRCGETA